MKSILIDGVGEVTLRKSRRAKRLILKVDQTGKPIVTIPAYAPYHIAEAFARKHQDWFRENMPADPPVVFRPGMRIGKSHALQFVSSQKSAPAARVSSLKITVSHPADMSQADPQVQQAAASGAIRALRKEAETELPSLLHQLARTYGYAYREVRIKAVYSRWGSCSHNKIINLSIWLMQLPQPLVEYILCHELAHLAHLNHSPAFWEAVEAMIPDYKARRRELKTYSPRLIQT